MPKFNFIFKHLLPFFILFNFPFLVDLSAQNVGTVRGIVTDTTNGEVLPFGNVLLQELNIGASTDTRGFFMIASVPADKNYTLVVSYVGYETKRIIFDIEPGQITHLQIELQPESVELQTVEKIGQRHEATIAQTAIAWLLATPAITSAIIGANSIDQLHETMLGADIKLDKDDKDSLDSITAWE